MNVYVVHIFFYSKFKCKFHLQVLVHNFLMFETAVPQTYRSTSWKLPVPCRSQQLVTRSLYHRWHSQWGSQFPFSGACCPEATQDSAMELGSWAEQPASKDWTLHMTHLSIISHSDDTDSYLHFLSKRLAAVTSSTWGDSWCNRILLSEEEQQKKHCSSKVYQEENTYMNCHCS